MRKEKNNFFFFLNVAKLYYGLIQVLAHLVRIVFYIRGEGLKVFVRVGTSCEPSVPVTLWFFFCGFERRKMHLYITCT